jgi:hypothetical protein
MYDLSGTLHFASPVELKNDFDAMGVFHTSSLSFSKSKLGCISIDCTNDNQLRHGWGSRKQREEDVWRSDPWAVFAYTRFIDCLRKEYVTEACGLAGSATLLKTLFMMKSRPSLFRIGALHLSFCMDARRDTPTADSWAWAS